MKLTADKIRDYGQFTPEELQAARESRREYDRQYRAAHPEKQKQYRTNYWIRRNARQAQAAAAAGNDK